MMHLFTKGKQRGQILIVIVLAMVGIIGIVGLAIDGGSVYLDRRNAQNAADSAALAGAIIRVNSPGADWVGAIISSAAGNGYNNDGAGIPRFDEVNERLGRATGWQVVAVPGLLPEPVFFSHLADRRFPVTVWLREEHEFDYIVEPDVFHDFFGHVPLLFDPVFADYMQAYGRGGQKADGLHALEFLARLYWYTVEFGLVRSSDALRIYGAGFPSSPSEVSYALSHPAPRRIASELERVPRAPAVLRASDLQALLGARP